MFSLRFLRVCLADEKEAQMEVADSDRSGLGRGMTQKLDGHSWDVIRKMQKARA